jgi:cell division protein FtsI/penicillin-binding protein 2
MFGLLKKFANYIKYKFSSGMKNRIELLSKFLISLSLFVLMALIIRTFITKPSQYINVHLHEIYDRDNKLMAYNVINYAVFVDPEKALNMEDVFQQVSHLTTKEKFQHHFENNYKFMIAKNLTIEDVEKIKHPALTVTKYNRRKYPLKKNFTTIGVADLQRGIVKGVEVLALEKQVKLTIDMRFQNILSTALEKAHKDLQTEVSFGLILNMKGEVLAMHTSNCSDSDRIVDFLNPLFFGLFEFASTIKVLTAFAGLHYGDFDMNTVFDTDEGKYIFGKIKQDFEAIPQFSKLSTIIAFSSNRGVVAAARKIGTKSGKNLIDFFKLLRLDETVDLGIMKSVKPKFFDKYKPDEVAGAAYGYNFMTNIFNVARAYLVIFTKGKIINPTILKDDNRDRIIGKIDSDVYDDVIELMKGTARRHKTLAKLGCASKSGTGDRIIRRSYDSTRVNSFFVCGVPGPSGDFEYLLIICNADPKDYKHAGLNSREIIAEIAEKIFTL